MAAHDIHEGPELVEAGDGLIRLNLGFPGEDGAAVRLHVDGSLARDLDAGDVLLVDVPNIESAKQPNSSNAFPNSKSTQYHHKLQHKLLIWNF